MRRTIAIILFIIVILPGQQLRSQTPFKRGVNLTGWFQTSGTKQIQFTKYTKKDFENIKSLGCDVIRLPINLFYMTDGKPDYNIDPLFYDFLDQAINWAEELKIYLMLDNHTSDDLASKNPDLETILAKVWKQMAGHYKNRSDYILYEIMNEPNGMTTAVWGKIQQTAIDAIRSMDAKHTIVVASFRFQYLQRIKPVALLYRYKSALHLSFLRSLLVYPSGSHLGHTLHGTTGQCPVSLCRRANARLAR